VADEAIRVDLVVDVCSLFGEKSLSSRRRESRRGRQPVREWHETRV